MLAIPENILSYLFCSADKNNVNTTNSENFGIFAEFGLWIRTINNSEWILTVLETIAPQPISNWSEQLLKILKYYSIRVPYSRLNVSEVL